MKVYLCIRAIRSPTRQTSEKIGMSLITLDNLSINTFNGKRTGGGADRKTGFQKHVCGVCRWVFPAIPPMLDFLSSLWSIYGLFPRVRKKDGIVPRIRRYQTLSKLGLVHHVSFVG